MPLLNIRWLFRWFTPTSERIFQNQRWLEQNTDINLVRMNDSDVEEVLETVNEDNHTAFVAATCTFDNDWNIILLNPGGFQKFGYSFVELTDRRTEPKFNERKEELINAAKCTCHVVALSPKGQVVSGTAFFVSATLLITAGHVAPKKGQLVLAERPGLFESEHPETLWERRDKLTTIIECRTVKTLYKGKKDKDGMDVSILDCSKSKYRATSWLQLNMTQPELEAKVDLIGYPSACNTWDLKKQYKFDVTFDDLGEVQRMLPPGRLVVSHGEICKEGEYVCYRLSSVKQMSGGPVIVNGKAVGRLN